MSKFIEVTFHYSQTAIPPQKRTVNIDHIIYFKDVEDMPYKSIITLCGTKEPLEFPISETYEKLQQLIIEVNNQCHQ